MSSSVGKSSKLGHLAEIVKLIFYPISREDREGEEGGLHLQRMSDGNREDFLRGSGGGGKSDGTLEQQQVGRMRDDIDSNTQLAKENRRMLVRIDERTAWIARLLVGVFMAILGAVYLSGGI